MEIPHTFKDCPQVAACGTGEVRKAQLDVDQPLAVLIIEGTATRLTRSVCKEARPVTTSSSQARGQRRERNVMRAVHRLAHRVSCIPAVALLLLASSNFQGARGSIEVPRRAVPAPPRPVGTSDPSGHNGGDEIVVGSDCCAAEGRTDVDSCGLDGAGMPSASQVSGSYATRGGGGGGVGVARRSSTQVCLVGHGGACVSFVLSRPGICRWW